MPDIFLAQYRSYCFYGNLEKWLLIFLLNNNNISNCSA